LRISQNHHISDYIFCPSYHNKTSYPPTTSINHYKELKINNQYSKKIMSGIDSICMASELW